MTTPGNAVCFPSSFPHSLWLTRCLQFGAFFPSIFPCHSFRRRKRACKKRRRTKLFLLFKHTRARRNEIQTVQSDESMNHAMKFNARNLFAEKFAENTLFFVLLLLIPCCFFGIWLEAFTRSNICVRDIRLCRVSFLCYNDFEYMYFSGI